MLTLIFMFEIIGTIAFAASGAMIAITKGMDVFGISVLGVITAIGGGIVRDLIIGCTPPVGFVDPTYLVISLIVSLLLCIPFIRRIILNKRVYDSIFLVMDAIGLGIFTVVGIKNAFSLGYHTIYLLTFVGVVSGVGGGILRDVFAGDMPLIFRKHIYASASIIGAVICILMLRHFSIGISISVGAVIVVVIRLLSAHFNLNLPKCE